MSFEPRTQNTIFESLRDRLTGKIPDLTNFTDTSFNWVWTQAFSAELREQELDKVSAYLSGLVDYAGGPITEEDLQELGIDDVADPEEINERLEDNDLDELVKIVGTTRDPGSAATGTVTFTTQSAPTTIPEGTSVGTQPDPTTGDFFEFTTDSEVSTSSGVTSVDASVTATEVGEDHNVGAGTLTYLPSPPAGLQGSTNNNATSGGEDEETNDELRERAKQAIFTTSGGGTVEGVKGFIEENVENVDEVEIIEFFTGDAWHGSYNHAHVIVSGGNESEVLDAIGSARPVAIEHFLVRPESFSIRVDLSLEGEDINTSRVQSDVESYIDSLGLDDEVVDSKIIQTVMNADSDIEDIASLELYIEDESIFYDNNTDIYALEFGSIMSDDGISLVEGDVDGNSHTFTEDADYQEWNTTAGDTTTPHDAINWDSPDIEAVADDGGVQTTETTEANESTADDMTLLPASPAVNDAYYFGGPETFEEVVLNISTAGVGTWTIVWEYWDGSAWTALSNVSDGTSGFTNSGENEINWDVPTDWETTTVNGIASTYWVRGRVDSFSSITTQPLGQEADLGQVPDITTGTQVSITFESGTDEYHIDDALIIDGITNVEGTLSGSSHTFIEGTDYEEVDVRADGVINGIDWGIGGDNPDDGTDFTVTYDEGTPFRVTYLIQDGSDIEFEQDTQPISGTVNVTVV